MESVWVLLLSLNYSVFFPSVLLLHDEHKFLSVYATVAEILKKFLAKCILHFKNFNVSKPENKTINTNFKKR